MHHGGPRGGVGCRVGQGKYWGCFPRMMSSSRYAAPLFEGKDRKISAVHSPPPPPSILAYLLGAVWFSV